MRWGAGTGLRDGEDSSTKLVAGFATRFIPCIYRRAAFPHRATPGPSPRQTLPYQGSVAQRSQLHVLHMVVLVKLSILSNPSFLSNDPCLSR